jgi:hypothetical protein
MAFTAGARSCGSAGLSLTVSSGILATFGLMLIERSHPIAIDRVGQRCLALLLAFGKPELRISSSAALAA